MPARLSSAEIAELAAVLAELTRAEGGRSQAASGAPLEAGLAAIARDLPRGALSQVLQRLAEALGRGQSLPVALTAATDDLPPHFTALIGAGLKCGRLGPLLEEYVRTEELAGDLSRQMWLAVAYPLFLLVGSLALGTLLLVGVVPQLAAAFDDLSITLPRATQLLIQLSENWWWLLGGGAVGLAITWGLYRWSLPAPLRRRLLLRAPLVGPVWRWAGWARFVQLLALLVEQAIPLPDAIRLAGAGVGDADIDDACRLTADDLSAGLSTAESNVCRERFPALVWQMLAWPPAQRDLPRTLRSLGEMFAGRARIQSILVTIVGPWFAMAAVAATLWLCILALLLPLSVFVQVMF